MHTYTYIVQLIIDKSSLEEGDIELEFISQWMDHARELNLRTHIMETPHNGPILVGYEQGAFAPGEVNKRLMEQAIKEYDETAWSLYFED